MIPKKLFPSASAGICTITLQPLHSAYASPTAKYSEARSTAPTISLREKDRVELRSPGSQSVSPIRDTFSLVAAGPQRLAFLRLKGEKDLVVVNEQGTVLHTVPLTQIPLSKEDRIDNLIWQQGTHFLVFVERSWKKRESYTEAYQVEAQTASVTKLSGFLCPSIESVSACVDGGFVVLANTDIYSGDNIYIYNAKGKKIYAIMGPDGSSPNDPPETLVSPISVTVLHNNGKNSNIAVLDVSRHTVQLYSLQGRYKRTILLDKAWQRSASYPSQIVADNQGGFIVHDFQAISDFKQMPSVYCMTGEGKLKQRFTPRYPNGTTIEYLEIAASAKGYLWVTDSISLLRFNEHGNTVQRLGDAPELNRLRDIGELRMTKEERILAQDRITGAVHVFDAEGRWLHACKPHNAVPEKRHLIHSEIEIGPNNSFAIDQEWFNAEGKPEKKHANFQTIRERFSKIKSGPVYKGPKRSAFIFPISYAVADNGSSAAIYLTNEEKEKPRLVLCLYSTTNTLLRQVVLPVSVDDWVSGLAYDGKQVIFTSNGRVYCYRASGKLSWQCALPRKNAGDLTWSVFLTDESRILCLFDGNRSLYRYAMPDNTQ